MGNASDNNPGPSGLFNNRRYDIRSVHPSKKIMRLAYFDHSGLASIEQEPITVAVALLVDPDREWQPVEASRDELLSDYHLPLNFEIHAKELFHFPELRNLLKRHVGIIKQHNLPLFYGAVDRRQYQQDFPELPPEQQTHDVKMLSFLYALSMLDLWLSIYHNDERAMIIPNEEQYRRQKQKQSFIQGIVTGFRKFLPDEECKLNNIVEAPFFVDSEVSIGVQLADNCVYVLKRHLSGNRGVQDFMDIIQPQVIASYSYKDAHPYFRDAHIHEE